MKRPLRVLLVLLAVLLAASSGLSLALRGGWARRSLLATLSAGFGRPVEVGRFGFSLFSGFRLEAQSVTVAEDRRFGQEYFLRAEKLSASLRWSALVRGRFELDTVSLSHPSLNLVRLGDGQWNIESWLPRLPEPDGTVKNGSVVQAGPSPPTAVARISRIQVDAGRINFKRDTRKLPLALASVSGRLDYDSTGHWNIDLQAAPLRAPAALQEAGRLRLRGVVGGVSARLRPAALELTCQNASLADLSRLLAGVDWGVRGTLNGELSAKIADSPMESAAFDWAIEGRLRIQDVHGWALPARTADPNLTAVFQGVWNPSEYRLQIKSAALESLHSRANAALNLDWSQGFNPELQIASAHFAVDDLLSWRRAFTSAAENISAEGTIDGEFAGSGWPLRIENLSLQSSAAAIKFAQLPQPIRTGPFSANWIRGSLKVPAVSVFLPSAPAISEVKTGDAPQPANSVAGSNALRIEASLGTFETLNEIRDASYRINISGATRRAEYLLAITRAWRGSKGSWGATGDLSLQLSLAGSFHAPGFETTGTIQARNLQISTTTLNQPVLVSSGVMDLRGNERRISLTSAEAFGANWTGSLREDTDNSRWNFDLSADRLDTSELNAWLGSQTRTNLLRRMLPFGGSGNTSDSQIRTDALGGLRARGRLRISEIAFSPVNIEKLDSGVFIEGASLTLREGRASFLGGQFSGDFEASLAAAPSFAINGQFARLDMRDLSEFVALPGNLSGFASGEVKIAASGADRIAIGRSLVGEVSLRVPDASSSRMRWAELNRESSTADESPATSWVFSINAGLQLGGSRILINRAEIVNGSDQLDVSGTVDFSRRIDLRVKHAPRPQKLSRIESRGPEGWTITGTLDTPRLNSVPPAATPTGVPLASR